MSNGKPCTNHSIPENICAACRGAAEERERILEILRHEAAIVWGTNPEATIDEFNRGVLAALGKSIQMIVG